MSNNHSRVAIFFLLALTVSCADTVTIVDPAPTYVHVSDELQARINDLNRTLVRCWEVPSCRGQHLITWTSWDSAHAPAFIIRPKP